MQMASLFLLKDKPLLFKGGTSLWYFRKLPRFSFDLDFTATGNLPANLGQDLIEDLDRDRVFGIKAAPESEIKCDDKGPWFNLKLRRPAFRSIDARHSQEDLCEDDHRRQHSGNGRNRAGRVDC